jgi:CBS domain-containing protein
MELARNLRKDPVSRLDPSPPRYVERTATVADAVAVMREDNIGCVLVCEDGQLIGLFTERDLMTRVLGVGKPLDLPVTDVMTRDLVTVQPRDPIPVVDDTNRPVGVLSVKRVVHYLVEHYPGAVYNQPPPGQVPDSPEGA